MREKRVRRIWSSMRAVAILLVSSILAISVNYCQSLWLSTTISTPHSAAITFANNNWNCETVTCNTTVKAGQAQPNYACAEFIARALATEGFMPGLSSTSPQRAYDSYRPAGSKKAYDLLLIGIVPGLHTLADYLLDYKYAENIGTNLSEAGAGDMVVFDDLENGEASPVHIALITVKGSSVSSTRVAAHNNARYNNPLINETAGFKGGWYILHLV